MSTGWICPRCEKSWAPHIDSCRVCEGGVVQVAQSPALAFADLWERYGKWAERHQAVSWGSSRRGHGEHHLLPHFGAMAWDRITHADLDAYCDKRLGEKGLVSKKPVEPQTVNLELASARRCINHCIGPKGGRIISGNNPFEKYPELKVVGKRRFAITEEDFVRLLEHSRPLLRLMLIFSFETGMRRDEFRCLEWTEVDWAKGIVQLPPGPRTKNRKGRDVPLSDVALAVLRSLPRFSKSVYVFENPKGNNKPVPETTFYTWFCNARDASGVKGPKDQAVWVHTLRKSFGTIMAMNGMPIYMLMEIMGHSDPEVHLEYVKMAPDHFQGARGRMNQRIGPQPSPATQAAPSANEQERTGLSPLLRYVGPSPGS